MKIDYCLVSCDLNELYLNNWDLIYNTWKKLCNIDVKLILIANEVPDDLPHKHNVILFHPIENINTAFQAQCIRLLYPCLFSNKNIIVSDMDIIPMSRTYFVDAIKDIKDDKFISYRDAYLNQNMIALCYNCANSKLWKKIFNIDNLTDINKTLKKWYNEEYTGKKNCEGWCTDQLQLYKHVYNKDFNVVLKDKELGFNRLDKRQRIYILENQDVVLNNARNIKYTDFHLIRPPSRYMRFIKKVFDESYEAHKD